MLALPLASIAGPGLWNVIFLLGFLNAPRVVRLVRSVVLGAREHLHMDAARAIGASDVRIMVRHIVPNVWSPVIVVARILMGGTVLTEASLSFLGVGVPPPAPSWGGMLNAGRRY